MVIRTHEDVTPAVLEVMRRTPDPRLREIMVSLITHLHGFIRDVRLTEPEFREATAIINEMGKLASDSHNETVMMCGSLGVSALVCLLNNGEGGTRETTQNLLGPFWRMHSPRIDNGGSIVRSDTPGPALFVTGRVVDRHGQPLAGAEVDVWHCSPQGYYENQEEQQADHNLRGKLVTNEQGQFWFRSVLMTGYPLPTNGTVGRLLKAQQRHAFRPAHLHTLIVKDGFKVLITQVYDRNDPHYDTDVQFGVTEATTGDFIRHNEPHPTAPDVQGAWYTLDYTYVMEPGTPVLPKPPIK
jgi:catechol 1,2-dioxygenase